MYDLFEHRHRFAVWAAARAAQRGLSAGVDVLREAIEKCGIVRFLEKKSTSPIDETGFEKRHRKWCSTIVKQLQEQGVSNATYGRAAKMVAVYLKSMVVIGPDSGTDLARVAHPPIDRILLQRMAGAPEIDSPHKRAWRKTNWTELGEQDYFKLVGQLRETLPPGESLWMLESFWTVTDE